jgi:hypothetical protein
MSGGSIGSIVGGIVGAVIGSIVPGVGTAIGFALGAAIGGVAGNLLDPPKTPELFGPRLEDLSVQTSTYGAFIPRNYGKIAQYGNIIWLENDKIKEVSTTTGGKGGSPVPKQTDYSYFATFAVGLCEGPIAGVMRIWIGSDLYYHAGGTSVEEIIASNKAQSTFKVYLGTDTQLPDPRIQANKGINNTSAYRGLAYIVFYDLPLEKYHNSLLGAQVKVEIVSNGTITGFTELASYTVSNAFASLGVQASSFRYEEPFLRFARPVNDTRFGTGLLDIYDYNVFTNAVTVNKLSIDVSLSTFGIGSGMSIGYDYFGSKDQNPGFIFDHSYEDPVSNVVNFYSVRNGYYYASLTNTGELARYTLGSGGTFVLVKSLLYIPPFTLNTTVSSNFFFVGTSLSYVYFGVTNLSGSRILLKFNATNGVFISQVNMSVNLRALSVTDSDRFYWLENGAGLRVTDNFFSSSTTISNTVFMPGAGTVGNNAWNCFEISTDLLVITYEDNVNVFTIKVYRIAGPFSENTVNLSTIVQNEVLKSNLLTSSDIDVTELIDIVRGYRVSSKGAIRAGIEPLRGAWPFDVIQDGYKIKFKKRGSAPVATILAKNLDSRPIGQQAGIQISNVREMDTILPKRVTIKYLDNKREYDQNEQYAERINSDSVNERTIDISVAFTADEGAKKAQTLLYLYWMERNDYKLSLPPIYQNLQPSDNIIVNTDNAIYNLRLTTVNYTSDQRLECLAKANVASIYSPTSVGDEGLSVGAGLKLPGTSLVKLLDVPMITDSENTAGYLAAMSGYTTSWTGGVLFKSDDSGQSYNTISSFSTPGATIGTAGTPIPSYISTAIDFSSRLRVFLKNGSLSSVTQDQMFNGSNLFAYGIDGRWEIMSAQTCILQGDGSYLLSDFLRGQFGTEQYTGAHVINDDIILLEPTNVLFNQITSSQINVSKKYKAVSNGNYLNSTSSVDFTYKGVNLLPLSPVLVTGYIVSGVNDWVITWTRRSRFFGWRDFIDAQLGETTESYSIEIYSSNTFVTLKRTLTSSTQTVTYTSANQITDFGSNQTTINIKIYQISSVVGRGYPATITLTR